MLRLLAVLSLLGMGGAFGIGLLEQKMLYPFDSRAISPAQAGVPRLSETRFETGGERLVVWSAAPRPSKPVILYFHGNAGNLALRARRFNALLDSGYGLVAMAYRGSSGSTGTPSQKAMTSDVRALYRDLGKVLDTDAPRVLYGESLGSAVVTVGIMSSVVRDAEKGTEPAAVVLEAPFTSVAQVAEALDPRLARLSPLLTSRWESLGQAHMLDVPLLVIHGEQDDLIPLEQGRRMFDAATAQDKRFLAVEGAGHTDLWRADVLETLWDFIETRT